MKTTYSLSATFGQLLSALIKSRQMKMWVLMIMFYFFFLQLNELFGHWGTRKILKAVLLSIYGFTYPPCFGNVGKSKVMKRFATLKFKSKMRMHPAYHVLNKMMKIF